MEHDASIKDGSGNTTEMVLPATDGVSLPAKSAAHRFIRISELVIRTSNHLPDEDLARLCLVDRYFNAVFSQRLYHHIRLDSRFLQPKSLAWITGNPRFNHTRILSFAQGTYFDASKIPGYQPARHQSPLPEWICTLVQKTATGVLRNSPKLHTINLDSAPIGSDKAVLIINNGLGGMFKRHSIELQTLVLLLGSTPCRELNASILEKGLLKSLCLTNIPIESWGAGMFCQILLKSPRLLYLEISYRSVNRATTPHPWVFEQICEQYKQLGGQPLKLEHVILGRGVGLKLPQDALLSGVVVDPSARASYLALLTNLSLVQEVSIQVCGFDTTAWATFDLSFFPNLKQLGIYAFSWVQREVSIFLKTDKTRDLLRHVHLHIGGELFSHYDDIRDMTMSLFAPCYADDPASILAPMGLSFHATFPMEHRYKRSIPLPMPTTRFLDITIHYRHLVGFAGKGLSEMPALECLNLNIYVYFGFEWGERRTIQERQMEALRKAAVTCPNLSYVRIQLGTAGPMRLSAAGLSGSWEIVRKRMPGSRSKKLHPEMVVVDAEDDKLLRPKSMWTGEEKRSAYVDDKKDSLGYYPPSWMK